MTSVPNHRQLLSGSKLVLFCLSVLLLAQGCFLFKQKEGKQGQDMDTEIIKPEEEKESGKDTSETTTTQGKDTLAIEDHIVRKDSYRITVFLPLHLDSVRTDTLSEFLFPSNQGDDDQEAKIPEECQLGLEFYEGVITASDSLSRYEGNISIHVYDTKNSKHHVQKLFINKDIESSDLIIGPVYNEPLKYAALKAKQHQIPIISPLSPTMVAQKPNPYFIMTNPSLKTHLDTLHKHIQTNHQTGNKIILFQEAGFEQKQANYLDSLVLKDTAYKADTATSAYIKAPVAADKAIQTVDSSFVDSLLLADSTNVFIVPSFDEAFINVVTRQLNAFADTQQIYLYGMPSWLEMGTLRLDYLDNLNFHYTKPYYTDRSTQQYQQFEQAFIDTFKTFPSETTLKAFDLIFYFSRLLHQKGPYLWESFPNQSAVEGLTTRFLIRPKRSGKAPSGSQQQKKTSILREGDPYKSKPDSNILFFENKSIYMMRYKNFEALPLNLR